jgi:subtilisin-like proprotein convertase family protein
MKSIRFALGLVTTVVVSSAVPAQTFNGNGLNPGDNSPAATDTINVTGVPTLVNFNIEVDVTWTTRHSFIGDVILSLTGPNATTIDLVNRPGRNAGAVGGSQFGDGSNFLGTYTFRDAAPLRIIDVASTLGAEDEPTGDVPSGAYRATSNTNVGSGGPAFSGETVQPLNTSFGSVGNGNWSLMFSDNSLGDYGQVNGWVLRFVPVPEPTSVLAIGAGVVGLAGFARRQLRRQPALA